MPTVRQQIAEHIKADLPAFTVKPYPVAAPDNIAASRPFVAVYRSELGLEPTALTHSITVDVLTGKTGEAGEDALEDALDDVLLSLQRMPGVLVSGAERQVYNEKFPGYKITAQALSPNVYRTAVNQESN